VTIKPGSRVRIPKGASVRSFGVTGEALRTSKRSQIVLVHHILDAHDGWTDYKEGYSCDPQPAKVCWAGTGGYWREVSIHDVEEVTQ
jgi:hypothetical protein